jgi:hypothetical protein
MCQPLTESTGREEYEQFVERRPCGRTEASWDVLRDGTAVSFKVQ